MQTQLVANVDSFEGHLAYRFIVGGGGTAASKQKGTALAALDMWTGRAGWAAYSCKPLLATTTGSACSSKSDRAIIITAAHTVAQLCQPLWQAVGLKR